MKETTRRLEALEARLRAMEDEFEIRDILARYGFALDCGDANAAAELFSCDSVATIDGGRRVMHGQSGIREMVLGSENQSILPGSSHAVGPVVIEVDGDEAIAVGYQRVDYSEDHRVSPIRISVDLWRLARHPEGWVILEHQTQFLGTTAGQALLRQRLPRATRKRRPSSFHASGVTSP